MCSIKKRNNEEPMTEYLENLLVGCSLLQERQNTKSRDCVGTMLALWWCVPCVPKASTYSCLDLVANKPKHPQKTKPKASQFPILSK